MKHINLKKVIYMDYLIKHESTGSPEEFAKKLEISRSTLFEYLNYMREELMLAIIYDKYRSSYYYQGKDLVSLFNTLTPTFAY